MDPLTIGGIVAGVGSFLGGLLGFGSQKSANTTNLQVARETNAANRALAEYGYEMDLAQWHRQNEYNLPANQMLRYQQAGLNPHLIYSQGSSGNATQSPSYHVPTMQRAEVRPNIRPGQFDSVFAAYQSMMANQAQVDNLKAQNALIDAQAFKTVQEGISAEMDAGFSRWYNEDESFINADGEYEVHPSNRKKEWLLGYRTRGKAFEQAVRDLLYSERDYERLGKAMRQMDRDYDISGIHQKQFDENLSHSRLINPKLRELTNAQIDSLLENTFSRKLDNAFSAELWNYGLGKNTKPETLHISRAINRNYRRYVPGYERPMRRY